MPTADEFREALHEIFYEAFRDKKTTVDITAGELHRRVGGYPGPNHRMPLCCRVMRDEVDRVEGDRVLNEPPSGQGASLTIRYVLPRRGNR
jgi:hypothetical protein